jgi:hypothetical protein
LDGQIEKGVTENQEKETKVKINQKKDNRSSQ